MDLRHVALFLANLDGGGAERMMVNLAAGFADRDIDVDLVLAEARGPYLSEVPASVRLIDLRRRRVSAALPLLVRYLRRAAPQILVTTLPHSSLIALVARRFAGGTTKVFVREATTPSRNKTTLRRPRSFFAARLMRSAYGAADGVLAVSDGVAADLQNAWRVPGSKIATLYNPVVTPDIARRAAADPGHPWFGDGGPPVILAVGRLHPNKDFATLFRAFEIVRRHREARLVLLGEGPERIALGRLARELGLQAVIDMPGFASNPFAYMARADVFVLSSAYEGLPGVLIQALACGRPVVATDCESGPAEILENGRFGALVPVGDAAAMAAAIARTLDDPPDADTQRMASRRYASDRIVDDHVDLFTASL